MVVMATAAEVEAGLAEAMGLYGDRVVGVAGDLAVDLTRAWELAQTPGRLLIGTPRIVSWPVTGLALAVVVEEGRRAMKDRQTPTVHVREMLLTRARVEGFSLAFLGPSPSLEVLAAGAELTRVGDRAWPLVEVDRPFRGATRVRVPLGDGDRGIARRDRGGAEVVRVQPSTPWRCLVPVCELPSGPDVRDLRVEAGPGRIVQALRGTRRVRAPLVVLSPSRRWGRCRRSWQGRSTSASASSIAGIAPTDSACCGRHRARPDRPG